MSNTVRNACLAAGFVALSGATLAARPVDRVGTMPNPLRIGMVADSIGNRAFMGTVQFKVTNSSSQTMRVPYWQLPAGTLQSNLFKVFYNGKPVQYTGPQIKRSAPTEADFVTLRPGESRLVTVDLSQSYDMSRPGEYSVQFRTFLQGARSENGRRVAAANGGLAKVESAPLRLWVSAQNPLGSLKGDGRVVIQAKPGSGGTVVNGVTFVGCSSTQINGAGQAVVDARAYSENAKGYLAGNTVGPRYTTWFGAYTATRYATVRSHFSAIASALNTQSIVYDCSCSDSYYAYVYPTQPYKIYVCNAFWSAPNTGTDSRAGTIVHETSHFNVVAGTDDHAYGQTAAKRLAQKQPAKAIDNADSHEYFAENTPAQN